jgi:hypothetical protein
VNSPSGTSVTVYEAAGLVGSVISGPNEYANMYTISAGGYTASPASGTVTVQLVPGNGVTIVEPVVFTPSSVAPPPKSTSSTPSDTYLSSLAYGIIGALVVVLLIVIVLAAMMGRRKEKPPAQTWDEPKTGESMGGSSGGTQGGSMGGPGGSS